MFLNITDPIKASYEVEDPEYSMVQLAQTSTRAEVARLVLQKVPSEANPKVRNHGEGPY